MGKWWLKFNVAEAAGVLLLAVVNCAPIAPTTNNPKVLDANRLEKEGRIDAALAALDQAIGDRPDDSVAWSNRGTLYLKNNLFDQAIADFSQAIALKETGLYYANRGAAEVLKGLYDEAIVDFDKAEGLGFHDPSSTTLRGKAYFEKGQYDHAVKHCTAAIEKDSHQVTAYGLRGVALALLGRDADALPDLDRYLSTNPRHVRTLWLQGKAFMKTGQTERARENVRKLIDLEPRLAVSFGGDQALDVYDLEKRRGLVKQALMEAKAAEANGQWEKAFHQFERARAYMSGQMAEDRASQLTILDGARRSYAKLSVKPDLPEQARKFGVQAVSMAEQKNYERAVALYSKALGVSYWWPEGHFNRALLLAEQAHFEEAIVEIKAFLELAPTSPDARAAQDKIYEWELKTK